MCSPRCKHTHGTVLNEKHGTLLLKCNFDTILSSCLSRTILKIPLSGTYIQDHSSQMTPTQTDVVLVLVRKNVYMAQRNLARTHNPIDLTVSAGFGSPCIHNVNIMIPDGLLLETQNTMNTCKSEASSNHL